MIDHLDFTIRSLSELVNYQVSVVSTKVVEEVRDPNTDWALQVALPVSSADEESCDVVVVTDLRPLRIVLLKCLAANVAFGHVFILLPLLGTHPLYRSIRPKLLHDRRLPLDENVQELVERILFDLRHRQLIVIAESKAEDSCCGAHFVLLRVSCLLYLATKRLDDGLEVCIDHKRRRGVELVIVEL